MAELERRPQLQSHVLHDDVTAQQHQGLTINLLRGGKEEAVSQRAYYKDFLYEQFSQNYLIKTLNSKKICNKFRPKAFTGYIVR